MTTDSAELKALRQRPSRAIYWRCFHCGEGFTKAQVKHARDHFGADEGKEPVCQMRVPGEYNLLRMLRKAEDELENYRAEDTELWRALHSMSADYERRVRRAEELGYERGLHDRPLLATASDQPAQDMGEHHGNG